MASERERLSGIIPPVVTPFVGQEVAYEALAENIRKYNGAGLRGYMPLGSNGEFRSLTDEESLKVIDVVVANRAAGRTVVAGTQRESARATIEFTKRAADRGIDFASVLNPHYFRARMDDEALVRFFEEVADASPVPILLYNSPAFSGGVALSVAAVARLAAHPNIAGMKDGTDEPVSALLAALPPGADFSLLAGKESKYCPALADGAVGGVLALANFLPAECAAWQGLAAAGGPGAAEAHRAICRLDAAVSGRYGVAGVKRAMDLLGFSGGEPRVPLLPLSPAQERELRATLEAEGLVR